MAYAVFRNTVPLEPMVVQVKPILFAAHAPNPNAVQLLIDFVLSEGQSSSSVSDIFQSAAMWSRTLCLLAWVFFYGFFDYVLHLPFPERLLFSRLG